MTTTPTPTFDVAVTVPTDLRDRLDEADSLADRFLVDDAATYAIAAQHVAEWKDLDRRLAALWKPTKQAIGQAQREIRALERKMRDPVALAIGVLEGKRAAFKRAADEAAAKERARLQAIADREAKEAAAKEAKRIAAAAKRAKQRGDEERAKALAEEKELVRATAQAPRVDVVSDAVEPVGTWTRRKPATATCVDLRALVVAVAAGDEPIDLLQVDQRALNRHAVACGPSFAVPGCVYEPGEVTYASRRSS